VISVIVPLVASAALLEFPDLGSLLVTPEIVGATGEDVTMMEAGTVVIGRCAQGAKPIDAFPRTSWSSG